jgi:hypothetical protein
LALVVIVEVFRAYRRWHRSWLVVNVFERLKFEIKQARAGVLIEVLNLDE